MKNNVYRTIFFIHLTVWVAFPLFTSADDSSSESKALEKLNSARYHFWKGRLQHVKAILDPKAHRPDDLEAGERLRNLDDLSRKNQAQAFMYLGYSHLNLGNKSEACGNFIEAFELDPHLKLEKGAVRDTRFEEIIKEAEIAVQIERQLDLFVAVDLSKSIPQAQVKKIIKLQDTVLDKLKKEDHVSFSGFGDFRLKDSDIEYPVGSPWPDPVESLRTDSWTDFSTLFSRLEDSITNREEEEPENEPVSQKAVLIISDGAHSVENENGSEEGGIPQSVTNAIKKFSISCQNVPIVVVTISEEDKRGVGYARLWTKELESYPDPIGKGLYYRSTSEPQDILDRVFKVITPHRVQMIVTRDPNDENKGDVFIDRNLDRNCTVGVLIQCPLPEAFLKVSVTPSDMFGCKWERAEEHWEDRFIITRSGDYYERVKVTDRIQENSSADGQQAPPIITLTFFQSPRQGTNQGEKIGKISLLFKKDRPTLQITKEFGKTVILKSNEDKDLKFQTKIDFSNHPFKLPIPLNVTAPQTDCFDGFSKTELIPIDTTGSPGKHKFNLSIKAKRSDEFLSRVDSKDISVNFKIDGDSTKPQIEKINFRLVSKQVYSLYWISYIIGIFVIIFLLFFPLFGKVYKITPDETAASDGGCKVLGDTIYDSGGKPVLRLQQMSWFGYLKRIENNLKSDIRQVVLLPQSSRKRRKNKTGGINSLDGKFLWPKRVSQIVLQENGRSASKFNVHWNYTYRIWSENLNRSLPYFGFVATVFLGACFLAWLYVSSPLSLLQIIILLVVLIVFIGAAWFYRFSSHGQESDLYKVGPLRKISSGIGLLDATIDLLEFLQWIFP